MATYISTVSEKRKNACAINLMRSMLIKFAQKHNCEVTLSHPHE